MDYDKGNCPVILDYYFGDVPGLFKAASIGAGFWYLPE
jgi:hypothetical protein